MKFCWCSILVKNMEESVRFYRDIVGLSIIRKLTAWPNVEIVFMGDSEEEIELIYNPKNDPPAVGDGIALGFETESVEEKMNFLRSKGLEIEGGPFKPSQYITFINMRDPNGIRVQFIQKHYPRIPKK